MDGQAEPRRASGSPRLINEIYMMTKRSCTMVEVPPVFILSHRVFYSIHRILSSHLLIVCLLTVLH